MTGWAGFTVAFVAFFATHNVPLRPNIRARLVGIFGKRGFTALYSLLSLMMLAWLIVAAANAPYVALWPRAPWQNWVPLIAVAVVCALICLSIARPNPLSFGSGRNDRFDPAHPGIVRYLRHPLLAALALWAAAHMVPNGNLAHVILFGVFAGFALLGMKIVDRRKKRLLGVERWADLRAQIASAPLIPRPASWRGAAVRLVLAGGLYVLIIALHPLVLGVSPLP